ncbi:MAG: hypothetical protein NVSMB42_02410 [Herpetosiphon sp.]
MIMVYYFEYRSVVDKQISVPLDRDINIESTLVQFSSVQSVASASLSIMVPESDSEIWDLVPQKRYGTLIVRKLDPHTARRI